MKVNIETLKDTFKFAYEAFEDSRKESNRILDFYHNRQYDDEQLNVLARRGSPQETFNVIKTFGRMLLGYYSTIVNAIKVVPVQQQDIGTAGILNDIVDYIFRTNNFISEAEKIKLDLILHGLMCSYVDVEEQKRTDEFGRPIFKIKVHHVPIMEIVMDPMSRLDDYSDARFIHRFKWVSKESMIESFGKSAVRGLEPYVNFLGQADTEFTKFFKDRFNGYEKSYDVYLLVHTIIKDDDGDTWEVYWSGDKIIEKKKVTFKEVKSPYRIHKLHTNTNCNEYYGIFREVAESQVAINQALVKIQLLVNTNQVYVEENAIDDVQALTDSINRVNSVIIVKDLQGIRVEKLSKDVADQYVIIDRALDRIQRILSINDSFLGMSYASESGAKVRLQQNASAVALRYLTLPMEQFYRLLGMDIVNLVKQYYTATDAIEVSDENNAAKWLEFNKPLMAPTGAMDPNTGEPIMDYVYEYYRDPASGEIKQDEYGRALLVPMPTTESDIQFTAADIKVDSVAYNDEDERVRLLMEQFLSGPLGQMLSQANPGGYFRAGALAIRETKVKNSDKLATILEETAASLSPDIAAMMQSGMMSGQEKPKSTSNQVTGM